GEVLVSAPAWFETLHVYVWPAVLLCAVSGYVLMWVRRATRWPGEESPGLASTFISSARGRRFGLAALVLLGAFSAAAPWTMESALVLRVAGGVARAAAGVLAFLGLPASASGNLLTTSRGAFVVTQECVATPLLAVYLAAALSLPASALGRMWATLATVPVIALLAMARLLALALPAALLDSP